MPHILLLLILTLAPICRVAQGQFILTPVLEASGVVPNTPTDSPGAGTYSSTQSVTLSDPTASVIYYTTSGSTPACPATGTLYTGAISISVTTTIKAVGCNGITGGGVLTSVYTISSGLSVVGSSAGYQASSTTLPGATALNVSSGDQLWAFVNNISESSPACAGTVTMDTTVGTWVQRGSTAYNNWNGNNCARQYSLNSTSANGSYTPTATLGANLGGASITVLQIRSTANAVPDQTANSFDSSTPPAMTARVPESPATVTTTVAAAIVVSAVATNAGGQTFSPGSCFGGTGVIPANSLDSGGFVAIQYIILSSTQIGSCTFSFTSTASNVMQLATFH